MSRWITVPLAAMCMLMMHNVAAAPNSARTLEPAGGSAPTRMESRLVTLTNAERTSRGLKPLAWEDTLCVAGRRHSTEMAALNYFDHSSPTRGMESAADRWERCITQPPMDYTIGENLFYGSLTDVAWAHRSLMDSAGHRENILNPVFTRIGIGVHTAPDGRMWVTEMFLS